MERTTTTGQTRQLKQPLKFENIRFTANPPPFLIIMAIMTVFSEARDNPIKNLKNDEIITKIIDGALPTSNEIKL